MKLTIACLYVRGHVPYTSDYVAKLYLMCRRYALRPFRFVCLTDRPEELPLFVEPIAIKPFDGLKAWWNKVRLFDPAIGLTGRCLYLDLDTLVISPLREVIDYPAPLALAPHAGTFQGSKKLKVVPRFNSSVIVWDAGVPPPVPDGVRWRSTSELFTRWSPTVATRLWGDQDWLGEQRPDAAAMPLAWFPRISEMRDRWSPEAKVVLVKKPKNEEAARRWPWFREQWGAPIRCAT